MHSNADKLQGVGRAKAAKAKAKAKAGGYRSSEELAGEMRQWIVSGKCRPGERLPNRLELREQFSSTAATIQRAFDQLDREGFVVARGRNGTFVSETPPHLTHYGLVFPESDAPSRPWSRFWQVMRSEAERFFEGDTQGRRFSIFYGPGDAEGLRSFQDLTERVAHDGLAGLMFPSEPFRFQKTSVLEKVGVPRIAITSRPPSDDVACIRLADMLEPALDYLMGQGCERIALVTPPIMGWHERFIAECKKRHLDCREHWIQAVHRSNDPVWTRHLVQLLLHPGQAVRPNGLIISDDNVLEAATQAIREAGMMVPGELHVVSHTNFPQPTPSHVPVTRMGYDMRQILSQAVAYIDGMRAGGNPSRDVTVPVVDEVDSGLHEATAH